MRPLATALYAVMAADDDLRDLLGTFSGGPSIFTKRPVPDEATRPIALAVTVASDVDEDFLAERGRVVVRDIGVYGNAQRDFDKVVAGAERVRALFHRRAVAVPGYHCLPIVAAGPIDAPAGPQEIGRIVTLTIRLRNLLASPDA